MEKNYLIIDNLTKIYDQNTANQITAVDKFFLKISQGDFVAIVGNNAAGKTTLLKLITGNLSPTSGTIILNGQLIHHLSEYKRSEFISIVKQNPDDCLITSMTIAENFALAKLKGEKASLKSGVNKERRNEIYSLLKPLGLGLEKRINDKVSLLSGGQKQVIALLMAVVNNPKLLLLDEHTASLDAKMSKMIMKITNDIVRKNKITTLMITHNLQQAFEYGNSLLILKGGKIRYQASGIKKQQVKLVDIENYLIQD